MADLFLYCTENMYNYKEMSSNLPQKPHRAMADPTLIPVSMLNVHVYSPRSPADSVKVKVKSIGGSFEPVSNDAVIV